MRWPQIAFMVLVLAASGATLYYLRQPGPALTPPPASPPQPLLTPQQQALADEIDALQGRLTFDVSRGEGINWNTVVTAVHKACKSGGDLSARQTVHSCEGDPVYSYLIVQQGALRLIVDAREDRFGSRTIHAWRGKNPRLGYHDAEALCSCGSGKSYQKCCSRNSQALFIEVEPGKPGKRHLEISAEWEPERPDTPLEP